MKKILKLTFILFLVCAIVAGVLGVINELTYERIAEQKRIKTEKAFAAVLPADGYTELDFDNADFPIVESVHAANGGGHVVQVKFSGAQGSITMVVGVDTEYKCTGISIISHAETSGLGANAASSAQVGVDYRNQYIGQGEDMAITKAGGTIDSLAGATITSRAITEAAASAISAVKSLG